MQCGTTSFECKEVESHLNKYLVHNGWVSDQKNCTHMTIDINCNLLV